MDEQPTQVTMRAPDGTFVMVLKRDEAEFSARGYEYMQTYPETPRAAPQMARETMAGSERKSRAHKSNA
jgi:hypothetical protein